MVVIPARTQVEDVRIANRALLLSLAREARILSRRTLADRSGLSRTAAYRIADDLQRDGVLVAGGTGPSRGGRRPQLLRFAPRSWFAVGVELGERDLHAVLTDLDGCVVRREDGVTRDVAPARVVAAVGDAVDRLLQGIPRQRVLGLGFASPGVVNMTTGVVQLALIYDWHDLALASLLRRATGLPTYLANRSKAAALGECYRGTGGDAHRLIYLYAGLGIAAGLVHDGDLDAGANDSEGEIGHITVERNGALCECGNHGCLHTVASGAVLLARARARLQQDASAPLWRWCGGNLQDLTTVALASAARAGDPIAALLLQEGGEALGVAAATLINLLNPDRLILGGPLAEAGSLFVDAVREEARRRSLPVPFRAVQIDPSTLGHDAGSIGAAALVLRRGVPASDP